MDYAEQLLKGVDYVIAARLQEHKFDETIICTVVDDTKASEGLYVVSDGTIKFDAYSESVDYKVDQAVRVNIPKGDYSQKKYIVGKAVSEKNGNQPIVYGAPSAQILDLTDNVFSKGSGRSWSIYANGGQREKLIQSINLRDQYGGLIYDTLYLKANFKTIFNQYAMCSGGYGIYIIATMASKDSSGKQNQRIYYFDSKHMFGNPYNYLISSSQETKFFIGKDESITNIAIYLYQDNSFKYKDSKGTIQTYSKSSLAEDIIVSDIYISLGADLTQVEDNKVEIQTTESLNYNDPQTDVDNTKIIRLQWYNKDENNQYIGFSDGVVPHFEDRKFLFIGDSYGVGINSESWQGWPYYAAMNMDFTRPSSGGVYPPKSGATRYINADPDWSQWIAIAQSGVGFAATSRHNPNNVIENEDNADQDYNFAELVIRANSILHTAKGNGTEANVLPPLPQGVTYYSQVLKDVTDIVVAGGWGDMWYDKSSDTISEDKEDIALGIINFIRNAVNVCSQLKRIYVCGVSSCASTYQGANNITATVAKSILKETYAQYANVIDSLNNCVEIQYEKDQKKKFTEKDGNQLKIIYPDGNTENCPELVFYDIHGILSDDDFKNDTSSTNFIREEDDSIHPAMNGYQKLGREIARRVCLIESELDYAKRLSEHNRIVAQMQKDGVPDDYAGFELNARYEEIKILSKSLQNLIDVDLYGEIKRFRNALNGKASDKFKEWINAMDTSPNYSGNIKTALTNLLAFYKNGLDFAKKVQDNLVYWDWDQKQENKKYFLKSDNSELIKQLDIRKIENLLLGKISNQDQTLYENGKIPDGYLIALKNSINNRLGVIKQAIQSDVNLGSIYDGYKVRIEKIRDKIIAETVKLKKLSCGNLYSIDVDLDNTAGNDTMVNYYTSWYLFEDPSHNENDENGRGLLTHRIRHEQEGELKKVSFIKTVYDPNKFDTKPNHYAISWYYYRNGYKAKEGENNLGGDDWCAIEDPGTVNGKPRFTVFNTNDNIGLPTAEPNETTGKLEYPKKPDIDDPKSYLTISFSKERPDIQQEKIKAVLIYNHEKYESNIITFENKDPAAGPELTNGIQIVHGSNSQAVYPLYGVDNTLITASELNTKRQLKVQYLNERGEPESGNETTLKGASIYWYVPTYATMLRTEDIDLISSSGQTEKFVKGSSVEQDFAVEKQMVTETEKEYVDICTLIYTTERPVFKGDYTNEKGEVISDQYLYVYQGGICHTSWANFPDGGTIKIKDKDGNDSAVSKKEPVKAVITYSYTYDSQHKQFYIMAGPKLDTVTFLTNGGITYSISSDGKYIVSSDNTKYYIQNDKVTLPVDIEDKDDRKGYECYYKRIEDVSDLTFTYRIKDYYSASFKNNIIKCKIIKGNQQLEGSISMDFNSYGSNGTSYSLVIKPLPIMDEDIQSLNYGSNEKPEFFIVNYRAFEIILFDYENKQIPFNSAPTVNITGKNAPTITVEPNASNEAGVLSYITNKIEVPHYDYHPWILEVTSNQPWPLNSDNFVELKSFYPIPLSGIGTKTNPGPYQGDFPTTIVYDSLGGTPSYYKDPLALYDKNGNLIENCVWSIQYYDDSRQLDTTNEDNRKKIKFSPQLQGNANGMAKLIPNIMYISNDTICTVLKCATKDGGFRWLQPLVICQNRYPSAMLNNWDGELSIDEDNNRILANIVGAGKKEDDNSFSGVLMGEVENADVPTDITRNDLQHPHTGLGLYGFHHGEQSFGFNVNGTAFIGKSGGGRIAFDGTHGFIYSGSWLNSFKDENGAYIKNPFNQNASTKVVTLNQGTDGMAIDLQNGHIDAYHFKLSSSGIQLNSDPLEGGDYIYIGQKQADGADPDQFIKYTQNGDLIMRVNSLALTGTIGGQNLLNNTTPKEALNLESNGTPIDVSSMEQWYTMGASEGAQDTRCSWKVCRSLDGKSWILLSNDVQNGEVNQAQKMRIAINYLNPSINHTNTNKKLENFTSGEYYTLSGTIFSNGKRKVTFWVGSWGGSSLRQDIATIETNGQDRQDFCYTFQVKNNNIQQRFVIEDSNIENSDIKDNITLATWFNHLKLEKGTVATPWNESDIDGYYNSVSNQLTQEIVFNKLTNNRTVEGIWLENGQLYINASYINSGTLTVKGVNGQIFKATVPDLQYPEGYVNIAGWEATYATQTQSADNRVFLLIGDSYGVGYNATKTNNSGWYGHGWPTILTRLWWNDIDYYKGGLIEPNSIGGLKPDGSGTWENDAEIQEWQNNYDQLSDEEKQNTLTNSYRYISAGFGNKGNKSAQWFTLNQGGIGFAAGTNYGGQYYNFSSFVDTTVDTTTQDKNNTRQNIVNLLVNKIQQVKLNDQGKDINEDFKNDIGNDVEKWVSTGLSAVTDIIVAGGWNDMWYRGATDLTRIPMEDSEPEDGWYVNINNNDSTKGAIASGIINFVTRAVDNFPNLQRISIFGIGFCDSMYSAENVSNAWAKSVLDDIYTSYANAVKYINDTQVYQNKNGETIDIQFYDTHNFNVAKGDFNDNDHMHPTEQGLRKIVNRLDYYFCKDSHSSRLVNNPQVADEDNGLGFFLSNIKSDYWAIEIGEKNVTFNEVNGGSYFQRPFMVSQDGTLWAKNARIGGVINADVLTANNQGVIAGWSFQDSKMTKTSIIREDKNNKAIEYYWTVIKAPTKPITAEDTPIIDQTFLAVQHVINEVDDNGYVAVDDKGNAIRKKDEWPFYVRHGGKLVANNAIIQGGTIGGITISSNGLSGTGWSLSNETSNIGGWTIGQTSLTNGTAGSNDSICLYTSDQESGQYQRLLIGSRFKVDKYGNITANGGSIGSWNITQLSGSTFTGLYSDETEVQGTTYKIYLTPKGISRMEQSGSGNAVWTSFTWGQIVHGLTGTQGVW